MGLGCEYVQPQWLADLAEKEGKPASWMFIQQEGGTRKSVEKGIAWVRMALKQLEDTPRVEMGMKDLGDRSRMRRKRLYQRTGRKCCGRPLFMISWWIWAEQPFLKKS